MDIAFDVVDKFYPELSRYLDPGSDGDDPVDLGTKLLGKDFYAHRVHDSVCCSSLTNWVYIDKHACLTELQWSDAKFTSLDASCECTYNSRT